jgi:hypothetical protein
MPICRLPDGAIVAAGAASYLISGGRTLEWTVSGYRETASSLSPAELLTPPSTVRTLSAGYRPILHPTANTPALT